MKAEIITIGDEILIGQVVDTNSAFIAKTLNKIGVSVYQITSIQDNRDHIIESLSQAEKRVDLVIITGGLGPTKDDITKHTFCEYFKDTLTEDPKVFAHIKTLFSKYLKREPEPINLLQALVPSRATVLMNEYGTAPGMWMENNRTIFVSLPGVPYEMKALMTNEVIPKIQKTQKLPFIIHKTIITYGLGESTIAHKIERWEDALPKHIRLAYLPNLGKVRLRLSAFGTNKKVLEMELLQFVKGLEPLIGDIIYGFEEEDSIELVINKKFSEKRKTLSVAESCTGGLLANRITSIPGASTFFKGSVVTYATASKISVLGIDPILIERYSVVSSEVAEAMARGVRDLYNTDFAIATTGNAGPSKGDSDAEVGTVYIAVATPEGIFSEKFMLGNHRIKVINKASNKALELLNKEISKI